MATYLAPATITLEQLQALPIADRLAFYREAAKNLAPKTAGKSARSPLLVSLNAFMAETANSWYDGRDAYHTIRAMRGQ